MNQNRSRTVPKKKPLFAKQVSDLATSFQSRLLRVPADVPDELPLPAWQAAIESGGLQVPESVLERLKTVRVSARQPFLSRKGDLYLAFFWPELVDPSDDVVTFGSGDRLEVTGFLWLIVPPGGHLAVDFVVQAEESGHFFHLNQVTPAGNVQFTFESTGATQHLTIAIGAQQPGFCGFDLRLTNRKNSDAAFFRWEAWKFFRCSIKELDQSVS
jgi:hypothetical protein